MIVAEPILQEACSRSDHCGRKVVTLIALLVGLSFTVLRCSEPFGQDATVQKPATTMALNLQMARAQQSMKLARAQQFLQPVEALQWTQLARTLPSMHSRQSMHSERPWLPMQATSIWHSVQPQRDRYFMQQVRALETAEEAADEDGPMAPLETGQIKKWNADRGFGFIKPSEGGDDIFLHISKLVDGKDSVRLGNTVTYTKEYNERRDKYEAHEVQVVEGGGSDDGPSESGMITRWYYDKGFGFIRPEDGQEDIFCHFSSLGGVEPIEGDQVTYTREVNERNGKEQARNVKVTDRITDI